MKLLQIQIAIDTDIVAISCQSRCDKIYSNRRYLLRAIEEIHSGCNPKDQIHSTCQISKIYIYISKLGIICYLVLKE